MANKEEQKRAGVWIRVSTESQVDDESPEVHERRARAYAEAKNWDVVETYRLDAVSGKSVMEHPEAKRMLDDVRRGHITALVFSRLARLSRNKRELEDFADHFRAHNADLISIQENFDTSTPSGRMFFSLVALFANWEREEIAARVNAAVPIRARMGKRLGGLPPFGYQWVDGKLIPHPDEAPVRVLMYELFREHKRLKTVARILNERGLRSRKGIPFSDTVVTHHLLDPTAKGVRRANFSKQDKNKGWVLKPESEWVYHEVPAIISQDLWSECHDFIMAKRASGKRIPRRVAHLFSGYVYCQCGKKMYVLYRTVKYCCRTCRNKIATGDLETIFEQELAAFTLSPKEITAHVAKIKASLAEKEALVGALVKEQKKVEANLETLYDLYQSQSIDKKSFTERHGKLATRRDQLENEIPETEGARDALKISILSQEEVFSEAQTLFSRWKTLEDPAKRQIVEALINRIIIHDGDVEIVLAYAPPKPQPSGGVRATIQTPGPAASSIPQNFSLNREKIANYPSVRLALLLHAPITLKTRKPQVFDFEPHTLGKHILRARLKKNLLQEDAARQIGVRVQALRSWENDHRQPHISQLVRIVAFIGYDPNLPKTAPLTLQERMREKRRVMGWSISEAARQYGVADHTWTRWENGITKRPPLEDIERFLKEFGVS